MKIALTIFAIAEGINILGAIFMDVLDYKHSPDSFVLTFPEWYSMMAIAKWDRFLSKNETHSE